MMLLRPVLVQTLFLTYHNPLLLQQHLSPLFEDFQLRRTLMHLGLFFGQQGMVLFLIQPFLIVSI